MTRTEALTTLHDNGYILEPPARLQRAAQEIDREACQEAICGNCGHQGLNYQPASRDGSYVALAYCPTCDHCEEF